MTSGFNPASRRRAGGSSEWINDRIARAVEIASNVLALVLLALALNVGVVLQAKAQGEVPASGSVEVDASLPTDVESIERRLAEVRAEIDRHELISADPSRAKELGSYRSSVGESLDALESILSQTLEVARRLSDPAAKEIAAMAQGSPSIFELGRLLTGRDFQEKAIDAARKGLMAARERLEAARTNADRSEKRRRQAQATDEAQRPVSLRDLDLARRLASEEVHLRFVEVQEYRQRLADAEAETSTPSEIEALREAIASGQAENEQGFRALLEQDVGLRRELEQRQRELSTLDLRIGSLGSKFAKVESGDSDLLSLAEVLAALRDTVRHETALLEARLERLAERSELWRAWEALASGRVSGEAREAALEQTALMTARLTLAQQRLQIRLEGQGRLVKRLDEKLGRSSASVAMRDVFEDYEEALRRLLRAEEGAIEEVRSDLRLAAQYQRDLEGAFSWRPAEAWARIKREARSLWNFEIASVQESPITIGSVLLAIILMSAGFWLSRRVSFSAAQAAERRFKLDAGASASLQTLLFYVLIVGFALLALRVVHFPLTAFTVAGGALAIGVGFGSQNVMNNFISGLILMLERPVRPHDMVEVDGSHGQIERIGARSTQIRSTDGRHIIVPNSFFLESNVVNWTLSDDLVRTTVTVGVAYGSPTRLVAELIRRVGDEVADVLSEPAPIIIFDEFGDSALTFELHFWVRARGPMQKKLVESQVRFAIDDLFRENDVVIAFPQSDVHLDSPRPIDVRMVDK